MQQHEQQQRQRQQQGQQKQLQPKGELEEQAYLERVTDESVQRGITAMKMFSDLAIQVDGTATECNIVRVNLDRVESKIDRLLNLIFATTKTQIDPDTRQVYYEMMTITTVQDQGPDQQQQEEECNNRKHVWMSSVFCDRCNEDFEDWYQEIPRKVVFDLVVEDLNKVLDEMWKEKRINRRNASEMYSTMMKWARDRGYIK